MAKGRKKKRGKCKCHDIASCTAYVKRAYGNRRRAGRRGRPVSSMTYPTGLKTTEGW